MKYEKFSLDTVSQSVVSDNLPPSFTTVVYTARDVLATLTARC